MASAYPAVRTSKSSRIPSLRTSKHFRKTSSQLELLKQNFQRKIFIEREEKLRICSAGDAHNEFISHKRPSLPPLSSKSNQLNRTQRRRTVGTIDISRFGNGPKVLTPIKSLKDPKYPVQPARRVPDPLSPEPQQPEQQQLRKQPEYHQPRKQDILAAKQRTPNRRYSRQQSEESESLHNENEADNYQYGRVTPQHEIIDSSRDGSEQNKSGRKQEEEIPDTIDWNICTEIIRDRTPTPLNIPDEGHKHVFRRGSPNVTRGSPVLNRTPIIPPIVKQTESRHHPDNVMKPDSRQKNNHRYTQIQRDKTIEREEATEQVRVPVNPRPKVKDPFKKKQQVVESNNDVPQDNTSLEGDKERMQMLIKRKQEELMKKIAEEEQRLAQIQQNEEKEREMLQKKRIEEQRRKRLEKLEEDKRRKLAEQNRKLSELGNSDNRDYRNNTPHIQDKQEMDQREQGHEDNAPELIYHMSLPDEQGEVLALTPCGICGRKFNADRLTKHAKICNKTSNTKRKKFDTTKQRVQGTDHAVYVAKGIHLKEPPKARRKDWKTAHEEFQTIVKSARTGDTAPAISNPDYVTCPHCNRSFNESAAERHIPRCKDLNTRKAPVRNTRKTRR